MGEIVTIDTEGMSLEDMVRASLGQGHQLHQCLEQHIAATRLAELTASDSRAAMATKVEGLTTAVGALETRQGVTEGSVAALAKALGGQITEQTGKPKVKVEAPMSWKDVLKVGATVLGALSGFVLFMQIIVPGVAASFEALMKAAP